MKSVATQPSRFIQIDEEGYFKIDGLRVADADADAGRTWLASLSLDDRGRAIATIADSIEINQVYVEAFDEPYVALDIEKSTPDWTITMPYGHSEVFALDSFSLDEWDRFHGKTSRGIPFVLSRPAQARFFGLVDEFEDDAIVVDGRRIETQPWLQDNPDANNNAWWTGIYRTEEPRWELHAPTHVLPTIVPRLKLQKCRVLVAGAGSGNDAAWFAEQGHIVTAVDFSEEAISRAQTKYGHVAGLKFLRANVFELPSTMNGAFDLIFEHSLFCAINPSRRKELVKIWRRILSDQGSLMGVFDAREKRFGPPFGGSEWEIRSRLENNFRPLLWNRLRDSRPHRLGMELFVFAQKISRLP